MNKRWLRFASLLLVLTLILGRRSFSRTRIRDSITITNSNGDRLSPWRIPLFMVDVPRGFPSWNSSNFHFFIAFRIKSFGFVGIFRASSNAVFVLTVLALFS